MLASTNCIHQHLTHSITIGVIVTSWARHVSFPPHHRNHPMKMSFLASLRHLENEHETSLAPARVPLPFHIPSVMMGGKWSHVLFGYYYFLYSILDFLRNWWKCCDALKRNRSRAVSERTSVDIFPLDLWRGFLWEPMAETDSPQPVSI